MNISQLDALRRSPPAAPRGKAGLPPGCWLFSLPLGFLLLCFLLFGDRLLPRPTLTTLPALLLPSDTLETPASTPITQASGWVEPDPYPLRVPVRVDGLVETVEVLEGESVRAGQLLATLDPVDFVYRLKSLESALEAGRAALSEKTQTLIRAEAETRRAKAGMQAAQARLREQSDRLRRVLALESGVVPEDDRLQVEREVAVGEAELAAAEAEWQAHLAHQEVEKAAIKSAEARVAELTALTGQARTDLERTKIFAPMDGVVLKRHTSPGGKRMRGMDDPESATIVTLFDPSRLQVRVDVPLTDAAKVKTGTPARMQISAFPDRQFSGEVTRIVGEADIARNTLQVKVTIRDPDPRLRPEMLCRVEFFSFPNPGSPDTDAFRASESVWIPEKAVNARQEVWVVDPVSSRVATRSVELGPESREGYRHARKGVQPGERVVLNPPPNLKPGQRVKTVSGEAL